jgi:lysyl-tRNA synthetase, class II
MRDIRIEKLKNIQATGQIPYQGQFDRKAMLSQVPHLTEGTVTSIAGRIVLLRDMGKMMFMTLQDQSGRAQIAFKTDVIGDTEFNRALEQCDLGDFIGVTGTRFTTKKGEPTLQVSEWKLLSKAIRQPPEKWHGVADQETAWRQRYLDLMSNRSSMERFLFRSNFIKLLREFYWQHNFTEVETPVLVNAASGTLATPFTTYHEAYDIDVYLRIAPETFLKECLVGGFDRVFECGRIFRNEGVDPSHLQDFTMCEHYASYWNYEDNMRFTEQMLQALTKELLGSSQVQIPDRDGNLVTVDFGGNWPVVSIADLIRQDSGIDIHALQTVEELRKAVASNGIELKVDINTLGRGGLIDQLYKKVSRPKLISPTFVTQHPIDLSPLARTNDANPTITDRFQLVVGTWEVVNAYSELIDPIDQAQRFEAQAKAQAAGDAEAHGKDDEYVKALEYGCPPCSGWGMGIDRMVALLTQQNNIREVVLFPLMKPEADASNQLPVAGNQKGENGNSKMENSNQKPELQSEPDETQKRFVAVLNKKIEIGKLVNALGHMSAGLSKLALENDDPCFLQYQDNNGEIHANISNYPFIVLKAENSNKLRNLRQSAKQKKILFTDFTSTMTLGSSEQQRLATKNTPEADLDYYGVCLFGSTSELREVTKSFSLFDISKQALASNQKPETSNEKLALPNDHGHHLLENDHGHHLLGTDHGEHLLANDHGHHLLQHADYGHLLPAAHNLLETHVTVTKAHLLATGATMAALAKRFGGNEQTWRVAGMLHDLDWDSLNKDWERHCGEELKTMLEGINAPEELLGDIRAHYAHRYGAEYPLNTMLRKALYCCDELTGFIIAVALVRPSKKLDDMEISSIKKKLKDKSFAAQVDREQIAACTPLLSLELDEMLTITLTAMKSIAKELGL